MSSYLREKTFEKNKVNKKGAASKWRKKCKIALASKRRNRNNGGKK